MFTEEELKQYHGRGLTVKQIAEKLGVSETTILRRMKKLGLDIKRSSSDKVVQEEPKDHTEKRRSEDKYSFLPPPSGGPPL
ncbi:MAG: response regulator transcription factor [Candidatus Freyarchaeota archaeon]|nr:response regulator transcription factor [Candidatus Jordarchaeia archaeon]MBS7267921.1 response regulator transcription factor [Candidatus Jordarchaeia archaeon]MBS7280673.1 response regulator transcription factor [Candidatus Jordarchaeia archaeon]